MDTSTLRQDIQSLVEKFDRDKHHYLSKDYLEAQTRKDFIDPLFEALGWDISNKDGLPPFEREVLLEKGETSGRPDYNFRLGGASKFFVEAKAPPESLDSVRHVLQAKSYAWNTKEVFIAVLTDFEGLKVFDASLTPDRKNPLQGLIIDLKYTEYLNNLDKLLLLSKEAVSQGSLERLLLKDAKSKRQRIPVDKKFLQDMGLWREGLAKDVYRHDPSISVRTLNEVVQRLLDRIVFIRIAEDRKIIELRTLFEIAQLWKAEGKKRPIQYHLNNLFREINADLNGDIFKSPHPCEQYEIDSALLSEIIEDLYFPNSPYLFDVIGVELLGSIYERYLGSTIRATPGGRVKVEEKPEVRKAGGVYYTPQYIVKYIVENTVGKLIEGKTPKQIEKIKILDPACGSGSFLLGAYQYLIDYHIKYYREHPKEAHVHPLFPDLIGRGDPVGRPYRLSIIKKGHILRNNLFGVDIDPQAVEITMMSLYLKALEGERTLPRKQGLLPVLSDNIKCGNSLIGYDIFDVSVGATQRVAPTKGQGILVGAGLPYPHITDEERERINPFDWDSRQTGFGEIMGRGGFDVVIGNPPYGAELCAGEKEYIKKNFETNTQDTAAYFLEKALTLSRRNFGMIVPKTIAFYSSWQSIRQFLLSKASLYTLLDAGVAFEAANYEQLVLCFEKASSKKKVMIRRAEPVKRYVDQKQIVDAGAVPASYPKIADVIIFSGLSKEEQSVIEKIYSNSIPLGEICEDSFRGLYIPDSEKEILKKGSWMFINKVPDVQRYFIEKIKMIDISHSEKYLKLAERILQPRIFFKVLRGERLVAYPDVKGEYLTTEKLVNFIVKKESNYHYNALVGIINSRVPSFYIQRILFSRTTETSRVMDLIYSQYIPVPKINFSNKRQKKSHDDLVTLVDRMLELNKKRHALPVSSQQEMVGREIAVTDERIDDLVYELYGITAGERKIIEGMG